MSEASKDSHYGFGIVVIVIIIIWFVLRATTVSGLKSYNKCVIDSSANENRLTQQTINAGYSPNDASSAANNITLQNIGDCYKQRPPDFLIWITGAATN